MPGQKISKKGFTLAELLIGLAIVSILAVIVTPVIFNTNTASERKIAESIKSDISKAFQLSTTHSGVIQSSDKPSNVVSKALNLNSPRALNATTVDYTTNSKWHVQVPNTWTTQNNSPDSAIVKVISDKSVEYSFTVFRDNTTVQRSNLADIQNVTLSTISNQQGTTTNTNTSPVSIVAHASNWVATVNVNSNMGGPVSGAMVSGSSAACGGGTTNANGQVIIGNIPNGTSCQYTASKSGFSDASSSTIVLSGNKTFNIQLIADTYDATVTVSSSNGGVLSGATVAGTAGCGNGTTNGSGVFIAANIPNGTSCRYTVSKANFVTETTASKTMTSDQSFTVTLDPLVWHATVTVTDAGGTPLPGATVTGSSADCKNGATNASGIAVMSNIPNGILCSYTVSKANFVTESTARKVMTADQAYVVSLDALVWDGTITVTSANGGAISGAAVVGSTGCRAGTTNANGVFIAANIPNGTSCSYLVSKAGFVNKSTPTKVMTADQSFAVSLDPVLWDVTIHMQPSGFGGDAISSVAITGTSGCGSGSTNASGILIIRNIPNATQCRYTATKPNYESATSNIYTIVADTNINLSLDPIFRTATIRTINEAGNALYNVDVQPSANCGAANNSGSSSTLNIGYINSGTTCRFTASKNGYDTVTSSSQVMSADRTFTITLPIKKWDATVTVSNSEGGKVAGATVTGSSAACGSGTTNSLGVVTFADIPNGTSCRYTADKTEFEDEPATAFKTMTANQSFAISLTPKRFTSTIRVNNSEGGVVAGATITSNDVDCGSGTTNSSGVLTITGIAYGTSCSYKAAKTDFKVEPFTAAQTMTANRTFNITLDSIQKWDLTLHVSSNVEAHIANADVIPLGSASSGCGARGRTDSTGKIVFKDITDGTACTYSISKSPYETDGSAYAVMTRDKTLEVQFFYYEPNVRIQVNDHFGNPVSGAAITASNPNCFSSTTARTTNGSGEVNDSWLFRNSDFPPTSACRFTATKANYLTASSASTVISRTGQTNYTITLSQVVSAIVNVRTEHPVLDSSAPGTGGDPLVGATVTGTTAGCGSGTTNASGIAIINNIASGTTCQYRVTANGRSVNSESKTLNFGDTVQERTYYIVLQPCGDNDHTYFKNICYTNAIIRDNYNAATPSGWPNGGNNSILLASGGNFPLPLQSFSASTDLYLNKNVANKVNAVSYICDIIGCPRNFPMVTNGLNWSNFYGFLSTEYLKDHIMIYDNNFRIKWAVGYLSPLKVNLRGEKALNNSDNSIYIDTDGFAAHSEPIIKSSGGLNKNEAWFIMDRKHNGIMINHNGNQILDGDDVFGDHNRKFNSGYEDIAQEFKQNVKTDKKAKRYIPLHQVSWFESTWVSAIRFFGFAKESNPSIDLYLLDTNNKTVRASDVLGRIDVSYRNVQEYDETSRNVIFQRANVTYLDGKVAEGADQWFSPVQATAPLTSSDKTIRINISDLSKSVF